MATTKRVLTAEDLWQLPERECRVELLDGELREMSPTEGEHSEILLIAGSALLAYVAAEDLGHVGGGDPGFILRRNPDHVRAPDLFFIARGRLPADQVPAGYFEIIPDFVIEIVSPGDAPMDVQAKIADWLRAGVRLVWAMDPGSWTISAHRGLDERQVYAADDLIDGTPVLPEFRARVGDLFTRRRPRQGDAARDPR